MKDYLLKDNGISFEIGEKVVESNPRDPLIKAINNVVLDYDSDIYIKLI